MTTAEAPESRRVAKNQPVQPGSGEPDAIARAIVARAQWVQRALSPWVGRWLRASAGTETRRETRLGRHTQTALTETHTNRLLDRVQRVVDRTTVWRADVGSVEPAMVDRFTSAIADRFSATGARYKPQPLAVSPAETTDLVLAGTPVQPGLGDAASLEFEAGGGEPAPRPTMTQLREILADRSSSPRSPPAPSQPSPPRIQRATAEPPGAGPPARTLPAQARLFSRVEELPPRGDISPEGQPPEVRPAQAERASEPSQPAEPPSPPVVQRRRPAVGEEAEPAQPEEPAALAAEAEPPRPRTRMSRISGSEVQRQPEEKPPSGPEVPAPPFERTRIGRISGSEVQRLPEGEMPSQVPALPEAPPSERTRIGRIGGSEVQRLPEGEMPSRVPALPEAPPSEGTRIGRISGSEVQRLPEGEMPSQVPSPTEAPLSERTRMGRISGSEVRRLHEGEMPSQVPSPTEAPPGPEVPEPPLAAVEPPMEPGQLRPARSSAEGVQRKVEPEEPAPGLEEEILARAASSARLSLTEPLSPASGLGRTGPPAQTTTLPRAQVQARFEDELVQARFADEGVVMPVSKPAPARAEPAHAGPARPPAWGGQFPLPPVSRPAPAALIQRQPVAPSVDLTVAARGVEVVQRAVETPPERGTTSEEEGPELDLDHLARQVYPLIKRMLAVERERRSAR